MKTHAISGLAHNFVLGATLPLLVFVSAATLAGVSRRQFLQQTRTLRGPVNWVAGVLFLLVGLNEIILYWLI